LRKSCKGELLKGKGETVAKKKEEGTSGSPSGGCTRRLGKILEKRERKGKVNLSSSGSHLFGGSRCKRRGAL